MNQDKAREYFSAYHEGTLEPGLRASLERKLGSDATLRAEYAAFSETIDVLDALRFERIESPSYLSERIATRLESARETASVPFWARWFAPQPAAQPNPRFVWVTGLAACLLLASIGLRGMESADAFKASILSGEGTEKVDWKEDGNAVVATFAGGSARDLTVTPQGGEAQKYRLASRQKLEITLKNPNAKAHRFTVTSGKDVFTVVLPGTRPTAKRPGSGTMDEFATALAESYDVPVVLAGTPVDATLKWEFADMKAQAAAEQGLKSVNRGSATMMGGNVLQIVR